MRYTSTRQFELPSAPAVRPRPWRPVAVAATWLTLPLALMLTFWPGAAAAQDCSGGDTPLLAGQFIDIGCVKISNDESELHITYVVDEPDWCMTKTHLHVADDPDAIPQSGSGNPIPGRFDYGNDHEPCVTRFGVDIDLGDRSAGSLLYIAAQAAVEDTLTGERQTAWGDGSRFQGTNWATYISYELRVSCPCFDPDVVFDSFPADWFSNLVDDAGLRQLRSVSCFFTTPQTSPYFEWKLYADGSCASPDPVLEGETAWSPVNSCRYFDRGVFGPAVSVAHGDLTEEQVMACADAVTDAMRAVGWLGAEVCGVGFDASCNQLKPIDPEAP